MSTRQAPKFPLLVAMSVETPAIDLPNWLSTLGEADQCRVATRSKDRRRRR